MGYFQFFEQFDVCLCVEPGGKACAEDWTGAGGGRLLETVPGGTEQLQGDDRAAEETVRGTQGQGRGQLEGHREPDEEDTPHTGQSTPFTEAPFTISSQMSTPLNSMHECHVCMTGGFSGMNSLTYSSRA